MKKVLGLLITASVMLFALSACNETAPEMNVDEVLIDESFTVADGNLNPVDVEFGTGQDALLESIDGAEFTNGNVVLTETAVTSVGEIQVDTTYVIGNTGGGSTDGLIMVSLTTAELSREDYDKLFTSLTEILTADLGEPEFSEHEPVTDRYTYGWSNVRLGSIQEPDSDVIKIDLTVANADMG